MSYRKTGELGLVLSRHEGESIIIGDDIAVKVVEFPEPDRGGQRVRLSIVAPRDVQVWRKEIHDQRRKAE